MWADVIRIVAILLVILLHTFKVSNENTISAVVSLVLVVFAKICVPLFVMLSGALLLPKQESWRLFFHKRVKRVAIPWITWTIVLFLITQLNSLSFSWETLAELRHAFTAYFTFIPLIICLYLLVPTLRVIVGGGGLAHVSYLVLLWFLGISVLPFARNSMAFPLSVDNGLVTQTVQFSGYLLAGWLLSQVVITKKTTFLAGIGLMIGSILWSAYLVQKNDQLNFTYSSYTSPWVIISSMLTFVFLIQSIPDGNKLPLIGQKLIRLLSQASFGVFLIHNHVIEIVGPFIFGLRFEQLTQNMLLWIIASIVSFSVILLLSQLKPVKKFVT